jgi:hypothetical protein
MRLLFLALTLLPTVVMAGQPCPPPIDVAKQFHGSSYAFFTEGAPAGVLTPEFQRVVSSEINCLKAEGLCRLGYDPWLGAQDGDMAGQPLFTLISGDLARTAVVQMNYRFVVDG